MRVKAERDPSHKNANTMQRNQLLFPDSCPPGQCKIYWIQQLRVNWTQFAFRFKCHSKTRVFQIYITEVLDWHNFSTWTKMTLCSRREGLLWSCLLFNKMPCFEKLFSFKFFLNKEKKFRTSIFKVKNWQKLRREYMFVQKEAHPSQVIFVNIGHGAYKFAYSLKIKW